MKKLVQLSIFLLSLAYPCATFSQLQPEWVAHTEGVNDNVEFHMILDQDDAAISIGYFEGTVDFDPGPGTTILTSQLGSKDIFIQKIDADGNFEWANTYGGSFDDFGYGVAVDSSGNIIATGTYSGLVNFDPLGSGFNSTSLGVKDAFVLKLDTDGNFIWHENFGGLLSETEGREIATDGSDNVIVGGLYDGSVEFNNGAGSNILTSLGFDDVFFLKLDASGTHVWAKSIQGAGVSSIGGATVDHQGNSIFTGSFNGGVDLDPNAATLPVSTNGFVDIFITKLAPNGSTVFSQQIGGTGADNTNDIHADQNNDIYVAGSFEQNVDFDAGGTGTATSLTSNGAKDAFLLRLNPFGAFDMVLQFGGSDVDNGYSVSTDENDDIYFSGNFRSTADLDPSSSSVINEVSNGLEDWFFEKLNDIGEYKWHFVAGDTGLDKPGDIYADSDGFIRYSSTWEFNVDLDPTTNTDIYPSAGTYDNAAVKLWQCEDKDTVLAVSTCEFYTAPSGLTTWSSSGTYNDVISTVDGCDSLITVNLTITGFPPVDAGLNQNICEGNSVTLFGSGADTYVWNGGVIDGGTFIPPLGTTQYILTGSFDNGCSSEDTVEVTVAPNPVLTVTPDLTFCLGDSVHLFVSGAAGYSWESGLSMSADYHLLPTASIDVEVEGVDPNGCNSKATISLTLDDPFAIEAGPDVNECSGTIVTLTATGGLDYEWFGPALSNLNSESVEIRVDSALSYFVSAKTAFGCTYGDSLNVTVISGEDCGVTVHNSFSPNNDGVNDFFEIGGIENFPSNDVTIFNRWGDEVFEAYDFTNENDRWDGRLWGGRFVPTGTYYYVVNFGNGRSEKGWLQVVR